MKLILTLFSIFTILILNAQTYPFFSKVYWSDGDYIPSSVLYTDSSKLLITGLYNNQGHITSADSLGNVEWSKSFQSLSTSLPGCELYEVIPTPDSAFIVVGNLMRQSAAYRDAICIKFNHQGDTLWTRVFNSSVDVNMSAYSVVQSIDSNILICGRRLDNAKSFLAKLDQNGNLIWSSEFTTPNGCGAEAIAENKDSTIYIAGKSLTGTTDYAGFISKFDFSGQLLWLKNFDDLEFHDLLISDDNLYLASLNPSSENAVFIKTDLNANVVWSYMSSSSFYENPNRISLKQLANGNFMCIYGDQYPESQFHIYDENGFLLNNLWLYMAASDVIETPENMLYFVGYGPVYGVKAILPYQHIGITRTDSLLTVYNCASSGFSNFSSYSIISQDVVASQSNTIVNLPTELLIESINVSYDNGCVDYYSGINENEISPSVSVFPTLSDGIFNFVQEDNIPIEVRIYNSLGNELLKSKEAASLEMDLAEFGNGIYFYKVLYQNNPIKSGRLILIK